MALSKDPVKRDRQLIRYKALKAGMTEDMYKDWLSGQFDVDSASKLSQRQLRSAHGKLNKLLDKDKPVSMWREPQILKLRALWHALADVGAVRVRDDSAMEAWCKKNQRGLSALRWAEQAQLQALIESLKQWANRTGADITV